jgi:hypothetical protein
MMEAVSTSETPANLYQTTRRNIPEDSHFEEDPSPWFLIKDKEVGGEMKQGFALKQKQ